MTRQANTHRVAVYLGTQHYLALKMLAEKSDEPLSTIVKRLLIDKLEEAAESSFKLSSALLNAAKHREISSQLIEEIHQLLERHRNELGVDDPEEVNI